MYALFEILNTHIGIVYYIITFIKVQAKVRAIIHVHGSPREHSMDL